MYEINRRFLDLVALRADGKQSGCYGLSAALCRQIAEMNASQREAMAMVPMLLVTATRLVAAGERAVRDSQGRGARLAEDVESAERSFASALLTWLIQDAQQNHSLASLWLGDSDLRHESISDLSFGEIQVLSRYADRILSACFGDRPQLWNDLVSAARSNNRRRQTRARLAALARASPPEFVRPARGVRGPR